MEQILGNDISVFVGVTLVLMGFATYMTGQALAVTWRPMWQALPYSLLLGAADRFLSWALFQGSLFAPMAYLVNTAILLVICFSSYRLTQARKMVSQYPWIYERTGPFSWREKGG